MATEIPQETNRGYSVKAISVDPPIVSNVISNPETTIYTRVIPAGVMGTAKEMSFNIFCRVTTGVLTPTLTLRLKLGSGTMVIVSGLGLTASLSTAAPFRIEGAICNYNNSSSQYVWARIHQPTASSPLALNTGSAYMDTEWNVDTKVPQTFSVTAQYGGLIAGASLQTKYIKLDLT